MMLTSNRFSSTLPLAAPVVLITAAGQAFGQNSDSHHHDHSRHDHQHDHAGQTTMAVERVILRWMTGDNAWGLIGSTRATTLVVASHKVTVPMPPLSLASSLFLIVILGLFFVLRSKRLRGPAKP